jgi:hypothetical protein
MELNILRQSLRYGNICTLPCSIMEETIDPSDNFKMGRYGDIRETVDVITSIIRPVFTHRLESNGNCVTQQVLSHDFLTSCWLETTPEPGLTPVYKAPCVDPLDNGRMNSYVYEGMTFDKPRSYPGIEMGKNQPWSSWAMHDKEKSLQWSHEKELFDCALPSRVIDCVELGKDENIPIADGYLCVP